MYKKLLGQTALYGLTTVIIRLFPFVITPILLKLFGPQAYAPYADFYSVAGVISVLLTHGMETTFFRFALDEKDDRKLISTTFFSVFVATVIFLAIVLINRVYFANVFETPDHVDLLTLITITLGLDAFCAIPFVLLRKNEQPLKYAAVRIINAVVNFLLVVFFYKFLINAPNGILGLKYNPDFGIGYAFVANLIASAVTFILLSKELVVARIKYFSWELWKKMMKYSWPITVAGLAGIINETFDRQFLKFLLPEGINQTQLGIYGGVTKIVTFVILFRQAYTLGIEPFFFSHSTDKNAKSTYVKLMDVFIAVNCLIVLFLCVNLGWISHYYIRNSEYYEGIPILPILFFASLFLGIYLNLSIWYKLTDKTIIGAYISFIGVLLTIGINFYFIPKYGYWASTWATFTSYFVMMVVSYIWGQIKYPIPYNLTKNVIIIGMTALFSWIAFQYLQDKYWLGNLLFVVLGIILIATQKIIPQGLLNKFKK